MRLPIIQTCSECGHCRRFGFGMNACSHVARPLPPASVRVALDKPTPSWCPLRTGPDEAELDALRAVAEAARAEHDARRAWASYYAGGPEAQINDVHAAIDATFAALRRLDEVRRG